MSNTENIETNVKSMFGPWPEHKLAIRNVCASGWTQSYPEWVREILTKALLTEELPQYAIPHLQKALRIAEAINRKLDKQVDELEKDQPKRSGNYNARKAEKRARDAELRARMKGHNAQPAKYGKK